RGAAQTESFHAQRRKFLVNYLLSHGCDAECRGKLVDVMLSSYGEAQGDYDEAMQSLLHQSRSEAGPTLGHLHARLLWCQVDSDGLEEFRDRVMVPALAQVLADPKSDPTLVEDLVGLAALVPAPAATDAKDQAAWVALVGTLGNKGNDRYQRTFNTRRASAARERANPPPMIKKVNFCNAAGSVTTVPTLDQ